jgi:hypothetical protein
LAVQFCAFFVGMADKKLPAAFWVGWWICSIEFVNHAWQQNQFSDIRWGLTEAKPILNSLSIGQVCYIPALSRLHTSCETISQYLRYGLDEYLPQKPQWVHIKALLMKGRSSPCCRSESSSTRACQHYKWCCNGVLQILLTARWELEES